MDSNEHDNELLGFKNRGEFDIPNWVSVSLSGVLDALKVINNNNNNNSRSH